MTEVLGGFKPGDVLRFHHTSGSKLVSWLNDGDVLFVMENQHTKLLCVRHLPSGKFWQVYVSNHQPKLEGTVITMAGNQLRKVSYDDT